MGVGKGSRSQLDEVSDCPLRGYGGDIVDMSACDVLCVSAVSQSPRCQRACERVRCR